MASDEREVDRHRMDAENHEDEAHEDENGEDEDQEHMDDGADVSSHGHPTPSPIDDHQSLNDLPNVQMICLAAPGLGILSSRSWPRTERLQPAAWSYGRC